MLTSGMVEPKSDVESGIIVRKGPFDDGDDDDVIDVGGNDDYVFHWEPLLPAKEIAKQMVKKTDATIDYGSIYDNAPNAKRAQKGQYPERRIVWEEQDCSTSFPASPEDAGLDVMHYIEQRDMWERRKVLHIPKFCVGSIVAVTRGDKWSEEGFSKFVGICIHINRFTNTKGHIFVLRNVILGQALEIQYPFYNPHSKNRSD